MATQLLLAVNFTLIVERRIDSSTYHTSEPALYLSIHILIISIRGIMSKGFVFLSVQKLESQVFLFLPLYFSDDIVTLRHLCKIFAKKIEG